MTGGPRQTPATIARGRATHDVISPVTGEVLDQVALSSRCEIAQMLDDLSGSHERLSEAELHRCLDRLREQLVERREYLVNLTAMETGFVSQDSIDTVDGVIEFLADFQAHVDARPARPQVIHAPFSPDFAGTMRIVHRPFRCVAAMVPQNASLSLSVIIIASALHAGARLVLRSSLQSACTGTVLAELVRESGLSERHVRIVNCAAGDFLTACYESDVVDLIHYIGSSGYTQNVFRDSYASGKSCLMDGSGNGLLYVDDSFPVERAVKLVTSGVTRFNGETCTSINGVLVSAPIYERFREALVDSISRLCVGHPLDVGVDVGPLFGERHARGLHETLCGTTGAGRLLCGAKLDGAYFTPALLEELDASHPIAREGFFGPAAWIQSIRVEELEHWLGANRYPLSDTVLTARPDFADAFAGVSRAARVCVNTDPSVESMFEPWGGYPPGGLNPVSTWVEKYLQTYQLVGCA